MIHHVEALGLDFNISPGGKQCCGSVQIRIIFRDPFLIVFGSGNVSYSNGNEHNKISWKENFN